MLWNSRKTIIIAGCGRLGSTLAGILSEEGHSVTVIDRDNSVFGRLPTSFSGFELLGDATDPDILLEAGIEKTAMVIATTNSDNVNCMIAQMASRIYGVGEVYARFNNLDKRHLIVGMNIKPIFPSLLSLQEFRRQSVLDIPVLDEEGMI